jgi:hypothetical protein
MWRRWSKPLEWLGGIRWGIHRRRLVRVGDPRTPDARGGLGWQAYRGAERLYDVWGPHPESPWGPFHCVPLFAALDRIPESDVGPAPSVEDGGWEHPRPHTRPGAPPAPWLAPDTWTIVDLSGPDAVEVGAWLVTSGCQPVCTFDNWPHTLGLIKAERILGELLRWATTIAHARVTMKPDAPPVWICDSQRLGSRQGSPGEFDNRYYLDDSILPGPALLRSTGIRQVVYVTSAMPEVPVIDLEEYLSDVRKAGFGLFHVDLTKSLEPSQLIVPGAPRKPPRAGFRRSAAGGFGTEVPEPSSGGGGG